MPCRVDINNLIATIRELHVCDIPKTISDYIYIYGSIQVHVSVNAVILGHAFVTHKQMVFHTLKSQGSHDMLTT